MHCPYCVSEIHPQALVCPTCRRDLYIVKPLLAKIETLEGRIAELEAQACAVPAAATVAVGADVPRDAGLATVPGQRVLMSMIIPVLILLSGHLVFDFLYDAKPAYLRTLALLTPLPFGYWLARATGKSIWTCALAGVVIAATAVIGMSTVTGLIDHVPIWPETLPDIRDYIEFTTSIALSYITGAWLATWQKQREHRSALRRTLNSPLLANGGKQVSESLSHLNDLGSALIALATTGVSIYTGLKGLFS